MQGRYDLWTVALSFLIAWFAAFAAIQLTARVRAVSTHANRWIWAGGTALGLGIWCMHFIGMLAFRLPAPILYGIPLTVASVVPAVLSSAWALYISGTRRRGLPELAVAAAVMGAGICAMHYTGMAAITFSPAPDWSTPWLLASFAVAVAVSMVALVLLTRLSWDRGEGRFGIELGAAAVMAMGICGMHYTGMAALRLQPGTFCVGRPGTVPGELLGPMVAIVATLFLAVLTVSSGRDRDRALQRAREAEDAAGRDRDIRVRAEALAAELTADLRASEQHIRRLAYFDALTGLPNRSSLQLRQAELLRQPPQGGFCLMFADLDGFKELNDSLGHDVGDGVLAEIAQRLRCVLEDHGDAFRFGGDEFIVLLPGGDARRDEEVANRLIREVALPLRAAGEHLAITVSLGSARYPDDGENGDLLLRRADNAMYHAKTAGKNVYLPFQKRMETAVTRHFLLLNDLRRAADEGQLRLRYQPLVDLRTRAVVGAEALVYWEHPEHGTITPTTFIPVAEESGLIEALGEWVLDEAVRQVVAWRDDGLPPLRMAVNVSGVQFRNRDRLRDAVQATLHRHGHPASALELELTERQLMHDPAASIATMEALAALGVAISLDDFGTGYSSLSYLRQFPLDKIKIDRSFTDHIDRERPGLAIVRAIAEMGHGLGMTVVAEGIERVTQIEPLLACGCREAQGYLFGRPMQADAFARALRAGDRARAVDAAQAGGFTASKGATH